mgnify:CR=1 FL=1
MWPTKNESVKNLITCIKAKHLKAAKLCVGGICKICHKHLKFEDFWQQQATDSMLPTFSNIWPHFPCLFAILFSFYYVTCSCCCCCCLCCCCSSSTTSHNWYVVNCCCCPFACCIFMPHKSDLICLSSINLWPSLGYWPSDLINCQH